MAAAAAQPHYIQTMTAHDLDLDQVVWAKVKGFSFWPGQIFEEDDKEVVPAGTVPVRFLDDNSWTYCKPLDILDFVADYDATYEVAMPKDKEHERSIDLDFSPPGTKRLRPNHRGDSPPRA